MSHAWGLLTYALNRQASGIGQYSLHLLDAYRQLGLQPLVLQAGGWPPGFDSTNLQTVRLRGASLLPALLTLGQALIGFHVRRRQLALVHDPTGVMPLALCPARRVVTICDDIPSIHPQISAALERLLHRWWLPLAVQSAHAVVTISQCSKADLQAHLHISPEKITVTPLAAAPTFRILQKAEIQPVLDYLGLSRPYILYVGSLQPRKNLLRLLDAYHELLTGSPRWSLVIVGATSYWKSTPVAEKVANLGLQEQVKFTGYLPDKDLPALYNAASLFCFPSLYEGFGLPVLEAMACGAPVVASNISSLPEVAGDAAILVNPKDVHQIALAMRQILEDAHLAQELRERGLRRAAQFTWEQTARQTIAVYEQVLGEKLC
jgi:glycosyltransferase involved in cell wall biosynthesis